MQRILNFIANKVASAYIFEATTKEQDLQGNIFIEEENCQNLHTRDLLCMQVV
jgi:hypothetical protein